MTVQSDNAISDISSLPILSQQGTCQDDYCFGAYGQTLPAISATVGQSVMLPTVISIPGWSQATWTLSSGDATISNRAVIPTAAGTVTATWSSQKPDSTNAFTGSVDINAAAAQTSPGPSTSSTAPSSPAPSVPASPEPSTLAPTPAPSSSGVAAPTGGSVGGLPAGVGTGVVVLALAGAALLVRQTRRGYAR
jgi:hypothetical protein